MQVLTDRPSRLPAPFSRIVARAIGAPILVAGALALWDPARHGGPPLCPMRLLTGVPCPFCGITRAAGALVRGHWHEAVTFHPLVLLAVVEVTVLWIIGSARAGGRDVPVPRRLASMVLVANAVVFVAVWALRLRSGAIDVAR
jgi:hypothetical protein